MQSVSEAFSASGLPETDRPRLDRLEDKPWGLRKFAVVDPDGNLLRIGQVIQNFADDRNRWSRFGHKRH